MDRHLEQFLENFARLADAAAARPADHQGEQLWEALAEHLGQDAAGIPGVLEEFGAHRLADASILLAGVEGIRRIIGWGSEERHHLSLADLLQSRQYHRAPVAAPGYRTVAVGPAESRRIIDDGLFLVDGVFGRLAVWLRGANPQFGRVSAGLEILGGDPDRVDAFSA
ncbi:hypothetical protein [Arthrobacter sp. JSM 101049]|uniref:hypothetical protein n=1 Tax=Arthrobacter sp. JSM 101049 TaxID=929097 RepID=UPI00356849BE